jgi:hypothetical protein
MSARHGVHSGAWDLSLCMYLRGLDGYSPRPPHPSEYRMQSTAHLRVLRADHGCCFGIGLPHARRTVVRVCSADTRADTRADQPRGHQPADARADLLADVSRRCAPRALDAAKSSDGAARVVQTVQY